MPTDPPFHNPFASLKRFVPEVQSPPTPPAKAPGEEGAAVGRPISRAVVRYERSGRGGKEVTVVTHLELSEADQGKWLKALKSALGCGGSIDGDALVLQGDQRPRLGALLTARGVKKVTIS
jgi:translation initiation factor 1